VQNIVLTVTTIQNYHESATNHIILLKALVEQCVSPDLDIAGADYGQPEFGMLDLDVDVAPCTKFRGSEKTRDH